MCVVFVPMKTRERKEAPRHRKRRMLQSSHLITTLPSIMYNFFFFDIVFETQPFLSNQCRMKRSRSPLNCSLPCISRNGTTDSPLCFFLPFRAPRMLSLWKKHKECYCIFPSLALPLSLSVSLENASKSLQPTQKSPTSKRTQVGLSAGSRTPIRPIRPIRRRS